MTGWEAMEIIRKDRTKGAFISGWPATNWVFFEGDVLMLHEAANRSVRSTVSATYFSSEGWAIKESASVLSISAPVHTEPSTPTVALWAKEAQARKDRVADLRREANKRICGELTNKPRGKK